MSEEKWMKWSGAGTSGGRGVVPVGNSGPQRRSMTRIFSLPCLGFEPRRYHLQSILGVQCVSIAMYCSLIIMAAPLNRAGHYGFFFLLFPRLFSAVTDWMSTILPHIVWP